MILEKNWISRNRIFRSIFFTRNAMLRVGIILPTTPYNQISYMSDLFVLANKFVILFATSRHPCWKNRSAGTTTTNVGLRPTLVIETLEQLNALLEDDEIVEIIWDWDDGDLSLDSRDKDQEEVSIITSHAIQDDDEDLEDEETKHIFPCRLCSLRFASTSQLVHHVSECHPFKCPVCGRGGYKGGVNVRSHCRIQHGLVVELCEMCALVFTQVEQKEQHFREQHSGALEDGSANTSTIASASANTSARPNTSASASTSATLVKVAPSLRCPRCPRHYETGDSLRKHVRKSHQMSVRTCTPCLRVFETSEARRIHLASREHRRAASSSPVIVFNSSSESLLKKKAAAAVTSPVIVPTSNESYLKKEAAAVTSIVTSTSIVPNSSETTTPPFPRRRRDSILSKDRYHCLYCASTYKVGSDCRKHSRRVHNVSSAVCQFCPGVFRTLRLRDAHVADCHKEEEQEMEAASTTTLKKASPSPGSKTTQASSSSTTTTLKKASPSPGSKTAPPPASSSYYSHDDADDLFCDMCQLTLASPEEKRLHVDALHPYKCPECPKRYKYSRGCRKHYQEHHNSQGQIYPCRACRTCFSDEDEFRRHLCQGTSHEDEEGEDEEGEFQKVEEENTKVGKELPVSISNKNYHLINR